MTVEEMVMTDKKMLTAEEMLSIMQQSVTGYDASTGRRMCVQVCVICLGHGHRTVKAGQIECVNCDGTGLQISSE
jgi:hypothetical protein